MGPNPALIAALVASAKQQVKQEADTAKAKVEAAPVVCEMPASSPSEAATAASQPHCDKVIPEELRFLQSEERSKVESALRDVQGGKDASALKTLEDELVEQSLTREISTNLAGMPWGMGLIILRDPARFAELRAQIPESTLNRVRGQIQMEMREIARGIGTESVLKESAVPRHVAHQLKDVQPQDFLVRDAGGKLDREATMKKIPALARATARDFKFDPTTVCATDAQKFAGEQAGRFGAKPDDICRRGRVSHAERKMLSAIDLREQLGQNVADAAGRVFGGIDIPPELRSKARAAANAAAPKRTEQWSEAYLRYICEHLPEYSAQAAPSVEKVMTPANVATVTEAENQYETAVGEVQSAVEDYLVEFCSELYLFVLELRLELEQERHDRQAESDKQRAEVDRLELAAQIRRDDIKGAERTRQVIAAALRGKNEINHHETRVFKNEKERVGERLAYVDRQIKRFDERQDDFISDTQGREDELLRQLIKLT